MVDYNKEHERLKTFECWPVKFISPVDLAAAGFYYYPKGFDVCDCHMCDLTIDDRVRCFYCKLELVKWENGDDPMTEHKKWSPSCAFVNNINSQNSQLEKKTVTDVLYSI